jgi:hypothetical protein
LGWRAGTPAPVLEGNPEWITLYWKAWENYHAGVVDEDRPSLMPRYHAPDGRFSFAEAVTQALWTKWGWRAAPAAATMRFVLSRVDNSGGVPAFIPTADQIGIGTVDRPSLAGWACSELATLSGDAEAAKAALPPLMRLHARISTQFIGEESTRRLPPAAALIPISPQEPQLPSPAEPSALLILEAEGMRRAARLAGSNAAASMYERFTSAEARRLVAAWKPEHKAFLAVDKESGAVERHSLAGVWTSMCERRELASARPTDSLADRDAFRTVNPYPALARGAPGFAADRGVRPLFQYLCLRALLAAGKRADAGYAAEAMLRAYARAAGDSRTLFAEYAPDYLEAAPGARRDSLEAGYIAVAGLIEAVIGLRVDGTRKVATWDIWRIDRHGVKGLRFGDANVSLICEPRDGRHDPPNLTIETDAAFTLEAVTSKGTFRHRFSPGRHAWSPAT